jgi:hypothetical protein
MRGSVPLLAADGIKVHSKRVAAEVYRKPT